MNNLKYPITVRPLTKEEGGGYLAEFPDLPGCMADGESIEEAIKEAKDALFSWIHTVKELGQSVPEPTSINQYSGQWRLRVPKSLHAALASRARNEGVSLNMLAVSLLSQGMGQNSTIRKQIISQENNG